MNSKILIFSLALSFASPAYSAERTEMGIVLSAGDQTFVKGFPVSCQAPLPVEGKYHLWLSLIVQDAQGKSTMLDREFEFTFKAIASAKELRKKADEIILDNNIDPNSIFQSNMTGPY
ncbi:MAG: hypothetical protein AB7K68_16620 [Bacteriovoracia bacterium]